MSETIEQSQAQPPIDKKYNTQQIAEAFQVTPEKTSRPEISVVGQHTAVGEYHVRLQDNEEADQAMEKVLSSADVVIVEFDSQYSGYEKATEHKRFMSMAQDAGQEKELVVMDAVNPLGIEAWKNAGITIEFNNYVALVALDCAQHPVVEMIATQNTKEIDQDETTHKIAAQITKKIPNIDSALAHQLAEGAKRAIMISTSLGGGQIFKLIEKYLLVDSFAREVGYQQIVAERVKKADQKRIVVVVGMAHLDAVKKALSGQFGSRKVKDEVLDQFKDVYGMVTMFVG